MIVAPASETITATSPLVPDLPDEEYTHMREIAKSALFHKRYGRTISPTEPESPYPYREPSVSERLFRNRYGSRTRNIKHYDHL
jgi:hypothetical protein